MFELFEHQLYLVVLMMSLQTVVTMHELDLNTKTDLSATNDKDTFFSLIILTEFLAKCLPNALHSYSVAVE